LQNGVNFLQHLAVQDYENLDGSSRLDIVEIGRVA
jgi:hypothetical protein